VASRSKLLSIKFAAHELTTSQSPSSLSATSRYFPQLTLEFAVKCTCTVSDWKSCCHGDMFLLPTAFSYWWIMSQKMLFMTLWDFRNLSLLLANWFPLVEVTQILSRPTKSHGYIRMICRCWQLANHNKYW